MIVIIAVAEQEALDFRVKLQLLVAVCNGLHYYSQLRLIEILLIGISGNGLAVKP